MTQMCEICAAVPQRLHRAVGRRCADAAADGGRRPRHHLGRVERDARPRWRRWSSSPSAAISPPRGALHHELLPLLQINFIESNPIPVKARWRRWACSKRSTGCRWCRRPASRERIADVLARRARDRSAGLTAARQTRTSPCDLSTDERLSSESRPLAAGATRRREQAREAFARLRAALSAGDARAAEPDASTPVGLARERLGQAGHPARLPLRRLVDMSADHGRWPFFDKDTLPLKTTRRRRRRAHRAGRIDGPRRRVSRAGRRSACRRCTSTSAPTSATRR